MTPSNPKPSPHDIDYALGDFYQHLLDRPVPARFSQLLKQLRAQETVLEPEV